MEDAKRKLIKLLQKAHAGELAAALAYGGHWRSLCDAQEIAAVQKIEADEWIHRRQIAEMLGELNAEPLFFREALFYLIGSSIALICHFCGRFCATYFAGVLEKTNVCEYETALTFAETLGLKNYADDFREMADTEAEHEMVLQKMIDGHQLLPFFAFFFRWGNDEKFIGRPQNVRF